MRELRTPIRPLISPRGFALAELVVILMILVFAGTLCLPAIQRNRLKTQSVACLAAQKPIFDAVVKYSENNADKRLPPLHIEGSKTTASRAFDVANYVHVSDPSNDLPDPRNWADILFDAKFAGIPQFSCPSDNRLVEGRYGQAKLSFGLNVYFYDQKVDGWGGSTRAKDSASYHSIGGQGDQGFGYYGPKRDTIKSPDKTIFLGDRKRGPGLIGSGAGIGYHWARYSLDLHRHGESLPLTFSDGHGESTSYQQLWGPLGGTFRSEHSLMTHVNLDFYLPRMDLLPHPRPNPHGVGSIEGFGASGPWSQTNYKSINPGFNQEISGTFALESVLMPYWQGWEKQPFAWK